jgi:hypothetical protein
LAILPPFDAKCVYSPCLTLGVHSLSNPRSSVFICVYLWPNRVFGSESRAPSCGAIVSRLPTRAAPFGATTVRSCEEFRTATTISRKGTKPAKKTNGFFFAGLAPLRDALFLSRLLREWLPGKAQDRAARTLERSPAAATGQQPSSEHQPTPETLPGSPATPASTRPSRAFRPLSGARCGG